MRNLIIGVLMLTSMAACDRLERPASDLWQETEFSVMGHPVSLSTLSTLSDSGSENESNQGVQPDGDSTMADFPASGYFENAARTKGEMKDALEAFLSAAKSQRFHVFQGSGTIDTANVDVPLGITKIMITCVSGGGGGGGGADGSSDGSDGGNGGASSVGVTAGWTVSTGGAASGGKGGKTAGKGGEGGHTQDVGLSARGGGPGQHGIAATDVSGGAGAQGQHGGGGGFGGKGTDGGGAGGGGSVVVVTQEQAVSGGEELNITMGASGAGGAAGGAFAGAGQQGAPGIVVIQW